MQVRLFLLLSLVLVWSQQVLASLDAVLRSAFVCRENVGRRRLGVIAVEYVLTIVQLL
jgi:hypothetical protein